MCKGHSTGEGAVIRIMSFRSGPKTRVGGRRTGQCARLEEIVNARFTKQSRVSNLGQRVIQRLEWLLDLPTNATGERNVRTEAPGILNVEAELTLLCAAGKEALRSVITGRLTQTYITSQLRQAAGHL